MKCLPVRRNDLLTRGLGSETVVVDGADNTAHALSPLAASVFALCDGRMTVEAAASSLSLSVVEVESAVVTLTSLGLVSGAGMTRRTAIQRASLIGGGALVASVAAPLAAAHASGFVSTGPTSTTIGNATIDRPNVDGASSITTLVTSAVVPAGKTMLTSFSAYTESSTGTLLFVVVGSDGTINYVSPNPVTPTAAAITTSGPVTVTVSEGDYIGFYSSMKGTVPFDATGAIDGSPTGGAVSQTASPSSPPAVGDQAAAYMYHGLSRTYSLSAVVQ